MEPVGNDLKMAPTTGPLSQGQEEEEETRSAQNQGPQTLSAGRDQTLA